MYLHTPTLLQDLGRKTGRVEIFTGSLKTPRRHLTSISRSRQPYLWIRNLLPVEITFVTGINPTREFLLKSCRELVLKYGGSIPLYKGA